VKKLGAVLIAIAILVVGVRFYRDWFAVQITNADVAIGCGVHSENTACKIRWNPRVAQFSHLPSKIARAEYAANSQATALQTACLSAAWQSRAGRENEKVSTKGRTESVGRTNCPTS
jgi:hypothetical protein